MTEKWRELDALIASLRSANQAEGTHQNGYQSWIASGSESDWIAVDEYNRANSVRAAQAVQVFLVANRGARLRPPFLSRNKLQTPWSIFKTYLT